MLLYFGQKFVHNPHHLIRNKHLWFSVIFPFRHIVDCVWPVCLYNQLTISVALESQFEFFSSDFQYSKWVCDAGRQMFTGGLCLCGRGASGVEVLWGFSWTLLCNALSSAVYTVYLHWNEKYRTFLMCLDLQNLTYMGICVNGCMNLPKIAVTVR